MHPNSTALILAAVLLLIAERGTALPERTISSGVGGAFFASTADIDADGDNDVVSISTIDNAVFWHENLNGDGTAWSDRVITRNAIGAYGIAIADIDGDGSLDVVSASRFDDKIAWYENSSGDGSAWVARTITRFTDGASSVAAADMDGDGDLDVLSASQNDDKVAWYENFLGNGVLWLPHVITAAADMAISVSASDVDGDGDMDAIAASFGDNKIAWHENVTGSGALWVEHLIVEADNARQAVGADLDGDGDTDVVTASFGDDLIAWHENLAGEGSQWLPHPINTEGKGAFALHISDMDRDGDLDVLAAFQNDNRIAWHENVSGDASLWTGRALTTSPVGAFSVFASDLNQDLLPDVIFTSVAENAVLWLESDETLKSTLLLQEVATDGIGKIDVVYEIRDAPSAPFEVGFYLSSNLEHDGGDPFLGSARVDAPEDLEPGLHTRTVSIGSEIPMPGAGRPEPDFDYYVIAVGQPERGAVPERTRTLYGAYLSWNGTLVVHGREDGLDVLLVTVNEPLNLLLNREDFQYEAGSVTGLRVRLHGGTNFAYGLGLTRPMRVWGGPSSDVLFGGNADDVLDGSGGSDQLFGGGGNDVLIGGEGNDALQGGTGYDSLVGGEGSDRCVGGLALGCEGGVGFVPPQSTGVSFEPPRGVDGDANGAVSVHAGDVDSDGDVDIVSASFYDDAIRWSENVNGDGSLWTTHDVSVSANGAHSVYLADVDGDGDLDLLSASEYDNKVAWYENLFGDGSAFTPHVIATDARNAATVVAGDVNGDGRIDVLSASFADDKIAWYENLDGEGLTWATRVISSQADMATSVGVADVDRDGDLDVLSASRGDNRIAWYRNLDGRGLLWSTHEVANNASAAISVSSSDIDGDGDVDLLSASRFDSKIAWYENQADGASWKSHVIANDADGAHQVQAADVDGDGDADVLSAAWLGGGVSWYENLNGDGSAWARHSLAEVDGAASVVAADLDGDMDLDVAFASIVADSVSWCESERRATHPARVVSARAEGGASMRVSYEVTSPLASLHLSVRRSLDDSLDPGDELLGSVSLSQPSELAVGLHQRVILIGPEIGLPGAGASENDENYRLLVAAHEGPGFPEDEGVPLQGAYFSPGGILFLHGGPDDSVDVFYATSTPLSLYALWNEQSLVYPTAAIRGVRARLRRGFNVVSALTALPSLRVWGGSGPDVLFGGLLPDVLDGGESEDFLFGGMGADVLLGGPGDDYLSGGSGADWIVGGDGIDRCVGETTTSCE